jgi:hypothetical protein
MNPKTSIVFSIASIAAVVLLFASDPIVGNQLAFADGHHYHHHH